jgi:hypothetical protein
MKLGEVCLRDVEAPILKAGKTGVGEASLSVRDGIPS